MAHGSGSVPGHLPQSVAAQTLNGRSMWQWWLAYLLLVGKCKTRQEETEVPMSPLGHAYSDMISSARYHSLVVPQARYRFLTPLEDI